MDRSDYEFSLEPVSEMGKPEGGISEQSRLKSDNFP